jgi:chromosome segregation ATPase
MNIKNVAEFKLHDEHIDWRREIEKSIERVSEKVASNNSNVLVAVLEKRVNDIYTDNAKLKKAFEDYLENSTVVKKNSEKFDKSEKVIQELISQVSTMKNSNLGYQTDLLKNLNELNEKVISQELMFEELECSELQTNKSLEMLSSEIRKITGEVKSLGDVKNNLSERLSSVEDRSIPELTRSCSKFKEDIVRIDGKLWVYLYSQREGTMGLLGFTDFGY